MSSSTKFESEQDARKKIPESDGLYFTRLNLKITTAVMLLVARSLVSPSLFGFVFSVFGSETSQFLWVLQVLNLKKMYGDSPSLFQTLFGKAALGCNVFCLGLILKNLLEGVFTVPFEYTSALERAKISPKISSQSYVVLRLLSLVFPFFVVSRRGKPVTVQRDIPFADLSKVSDKLLTRWKRSTPGMKKMNTMVLRGRISKWLSLDVFTCPEVHESTRNGLKPVVMYIHGGGWTVGDKQFAGLALLYRLAARGVVVATINYRLAPEAVWPAGILDCKRALIYVKKHCKEWGGDPNNVFVSGDSAGGHLSALMGCTGNFPLFQPDESKLEDTSVAGALPIYGVFDFTDAEGHLRAMRGNYLGLPIGVRPFFSMLVIQDIHDEETKHMWEEASPTFHVKRMLKESVTDPNLPPYFIPHGTADSLTSEKDAAHFFSALEDLRKKFPRADGGDAFISVSGGVHGFGYLPTPRSHAMADAFCDFIFHHTALRSSAAKL